MCKKNVWFTTSFAELWLTKFGLGISELLFVCVEMSYVKPVEHFEHCLHQDYVLMIIYGIKSIADLV